MKKEDIAILEEVLGTYRCLLSCRKKMPGMSLESAFKHETIKYLEDEFKWLESLLERVVYE
jgi:hypothetical protein